MLMLHPSQPSDFNCYSVQMDKAHSKYECYGLACSLTKFGENVKSHSFKKTQMSVCTLVKYSQTAAFSCSHPYEKRQSPHLEEVTWINAPNSYPRNGVRVCMKQKLNADILCLDSDDLLL